MAGQASGRKPRYKERADSVKREWERFYVEGHVDWKSVEAEANKLLPDLPVLEQGEIIYPQTPVSVVGRHFRKPDALPTVRFEQTVASIETKQVVTDKALVRNGKAKPPAPLRATPIDYRAPKDKYGNKCDRCGKPRSGFKPLSAEELARFGMKAPIYGDQKFYCYACTRLNAKERHEKKVVELASRRRAKKDELLARKTELMARKDAVLSARYDSMEKRDEAIAALNETIATYNLWLEDSTLCVPMAFGDHNARLEDFWAEIVRYQPDFSIDLIEMINDLEHEQGAPFVFIDFQDHEAKRLHHDWGHAAMKMFEQHPEKTRIRYRRPRWKMLRGQWA